jgi:predicted DNA-binding transcriptional regulator YafY
MNLEKLSRLLDLLRLLQSGSGHNANALALACGVNRRTIFRYLETLRSVGIPLEFDDELQRYSISGPSLLPPTNFTSDEALAVIALSHEMGGTGKIPFYAAARAAAMKLESNMPSRLREEMKKLTRTIRIHQSPVNEMAGLKSIYDELMDASAAHQAVRIRYDSFAEKEEIQTKLCTYQLLFSRHSWYAIGRSSLHREARTFNVGRIRSLERLDETFKIPQGFSIERYLRNAWNLIPESGPDREVTIRFQPLVARNVAEVSWHKTQRLEFNDDGTLDFHVSVSGLGEISWWILGYGDQAEVIGPPELRERVAGHAKRLLARYEAQG